MTAVAHDGAASVETPRVELADVFARHAKAYLSTHYATPIQRKVVRAVIACRTPALGGHRQWCQRCGYERYLYHSCRNRHCPKCQSLAKASWLADRQRELLPVPYFHQVFTLPHEVNPLILWNEENQRVLLNLLFQAAAQTLLEFGKNHLGGRVGFTMVLHTWDQQLRPHFHLDVLMASGALADGGCRWVAGGSTFLFPVRALSKVFRAKSLDGLAMLTDAKGQPHDAPIRQFNFHRRCFEGDRHEHRLARLGSLPSSLFSRHRLRDAIFESIHPAIEGRSRDPILEAENVDLQAARPVAFQPLLPVQIVVQIARWPAHRVSPKSAALQHSSIHDLTSMDWPDAYASHEFSGF